MRVSLTPLAGLCACGVGSFAIFFHCSASTRLSPHDRWDDSKKEKGRRKVVDVVYRLYEAVNPRRVAQRSAPDEYRLKVGYWDGQCQNIERQSYAEAHPSDQHGRA